MRHILACLFSLLCFDPLLLLAETAPNSEEEKISASVAGQVMSPFCAGRLLRDCPSSKARELRMEIKSMVRRGMSEAEIISELRTRFHDEILAAPEFSGVGVLAWTLPAIFLFAGFLLLIAWLSSRSQPASTTPSPPPLDNEMRARVADMVEGGTKMETTTDEEP